MGRVGLRQPGYGRIRGSPSVWRDLSCWRDRLSSGANLVPALALVQLAADSAPKLFVGDVSAQVGGVDESAVFLQRSGERVLDRYLSHVGVVDEDRADGGR